MEVKMDIWILLSVALPSAAGAILLAASFREHIKGKMQASVKGLHAYTAAVLMLSVAVTLYAAWTGERAMTLFTLLDGMPVCFRIDGLGRLFMTIVGIVWLATGFYSFVYMKHEGEEARFFGLYLLLYGVLAGLAFSGNLVTMYLFYELMTLVSMPMVLHNGSREAIMASLKYLFYSLCGAYGGLFGIVFLYRYCDSLTFTAGGTLNAAAVQGHEGILLIAVFVMILGFGAKAGMLPLHSWLPAAHPVAPSPASALLSGIIVKFGVLAVIRTVYYIVGPEFVRGTWVQYGWMILTLLTVFMGSMLAYREPALKKRLAYSTVSQVSYILFGLSLLTPDAMTGALLHTAAHAFVKCGLFLTAGVFLYQCGYTRVDQLTGIGKKMPKTLWCYTIFALALIGIPPTAGFVSKWYLAEGALASGIPVFSWLGPVVLLVSALLTAGYLLPVTMKGFFPGEEAASLDLSKKEPSLLLLVPLAVLAALALLLGILPNPLIRYAGEIAQAVFA
ncbi:MAG: proton-conducting membrane transporter [Blautia sp.]|nr:proton-conducting membrane transporter [Blautia sp.]